MTDRFRLKGDKMIWIIVVLLAMISITAVFSSSSFLAASKGTTRLNIFLEQSRSVAIGLAVLFVCYLIPLKFYRAFSFIFFGVSVILLMLLYTPLKAGDANGAVRGIRLFGKTVQVFEFAKVGIILYLARALELWGDSLDSFKQFALRILLPVCVVCVLILQNSFSSAMFVGIISMLTVFFMGVKLKNILYTIGIVAVFVLVFFATYHAFFAGRPERLESSAGKIFNRAGTVESRITNFLDEHKERSEEEMEAMSDEERMEKLEKNRQSDNAKYAIYEGGIFGKGPGNGTQRYSLSMAFSDFIYASIIEETGMIGGLFVMALYLIFLFRCIKISFRCSKVYSSALVAGLAFMIGCQAFLHILVNVRLFPITGHTLPLVSHGGTAYVVLCGVFGMILSVSKQLDKQDMIRQNAEKEANNG